MYEKNRILIAGVNSEEEFDLALEIINSKEEYITDKDLIFTPANINYGDYIYLGYHYEENKEPLYTKMEHFEEVDKEVE